MSEKPVPTNEQLWGAFFKSNTLNPWDARPSELTDALFWVWMDGWSAARKETASEAAVE